MIFKSVSLQNFRRHANATLSLDPNLTLVVGENDTGKSSLLDALRLLVGNTSLNDFDFHLDEPQLQVRGQLHDGVVRVVRGLREHRDGRPSVRTSRHLAVPAALVRTWKTEVEQAENLTDTLRALCRTLGVQVRSNSRFDTVRSSLITRLELPAGQSELLLEVAQFDDLPAYFLDGKHFENVEGFLREVYFREKQTSLWSEELPGAANAESPRTMLDFVRFKLDAYAAGIETSLREGGVTAKLQTYLPQLSGIRVSPQFDPRELNVSLGVRLVQGERELDLARFGDGTRRRVTLALLQHKVESTVDHALYVLDEPDAHLHVRAQYELLDILDAMGRRGHQVVLSTHSPFLMNAVPTRRVRLLRPYQNVTSIKHRLDAEERDEALTHLGVENVYLFFSRRFVIVEGQSEEAFLPIAYENRHGRAMGRDFIRIVRRPGIRDVPRFVKVLRDFVGPDDILVLTDNDADEETQQLLAALNIPIGNRFVVGTREFEDAFQPDLVHAAWQGYVRDAGQRLGPEWTPENIRELAFNPNGLKFSEALRPLNARCGVKLTKPALASALAKHVAFHQLPPVLQDLLNYMARE